MMDLYIKLSVCVPRLIPGRGFYAQISSEITSEFPGVTGVHLSVAGERRAARRLGWAGLGRFGRAEREGVLGRNRPNNLKEGFLNFFK